MASEKRTSANALDHSHHLSDFARRYGLSPLKGLQKYFENKNLISFSGGPSVFPRLSHANISPPCRHP